MYLIKKIGVKLTFDSEKLPKDTFYIEDGIPIVSIGTPRDFFSPFSFWGEISGYLDKKAMLPNYDEHHLSLTFVNDYSFTELGDGFVNFDFWTVSQTPNKIKGYLIFISYAREIETSGKKLFTRYGNEFIYELNEGDYLTLEGNTIKVFDGKLWHQV